MQQAKQPLDIQQHRLEQHRRATEMAFALAKRKNAEYGDAISSSGVAGCAIELLGVSARVWELTKRAMRGGSIAPEIREQLLDKALDGINYAVWLFAFLEDDNLAGK